MTSIEQAGHRNCALPELETDLLHDAAVDGSTSPLTWVEFAPHRVRAPMQIERDVLVLLDRGSLRAEATGVTRSRCYDLQPGSLGFFAKGTDIRQVDWQWSKARRIAVELLPLAGGDEWLGFAGSRPGETDFEFHDDELAQLLRTLGTELRHGSPRGRLYGDSLRLGVLWRVRQRRNPAGHRTGAALHPVRLQRVIELVEFQGASDLSLHTMAEAAGVPPGLFLRQFRRSTGQTPHQFLMARRLEKARALVLGTALPLAEVATAAGFSSQSHMTTLFSRAYGSTPGKLRRGLP